MTFMNASKRSSALHLEDALHCGSCAVSPNCNALYRVQCSSSKFNETLQSLSGGLSSFVCSEKRIETCRRRAALAISVLRLQAQKQSPSAQKLIER